MIYLSNNILRTKSHQAICKVQNTYCLYQFGSQKQQQKPLFCFSYFCLASSPMKTSSRLTHLEKKTYHNIPLSYTFCYFHPKAKLPSITYREHLFNERILLLITSDTWVTRYLQYGRC